MTSNSNTSDSNDNEVLSPESFTADNAVSHGGRFGTDDTAPERVNGLPPGVASREKDETAASDDSRS